MYGAIQHFEIAKKEGLKPLIGVDLCTHCVREGKTEKASYTTIYAKNYEGYRALLRLVSEAHTNSTGSIPCISLEKIAQDGNDLIVMMGGEHSYIGRLVHQGESVKKIEERIALYAKLFPEGQFFLEVTAQSHATVPTLKKVNEMIVSLSDALGLPCVVDNNFHYATSEEKDAFDIAGCIKDGKQYYEHGRKKKDGEWHIMSEKEVAAVVKSNGYTDEQFEQRCSNNKRLIGMIDTNIPLHQLLFPAYESSPEIQEIYKQFASMDA